MITNKYVEVLLKMMGDTFMYRARTVKLKDVTIDNDEVTIEVEEGHPIKTTVSGLKDTLAELLPTTYTKKKEGSREAAETVETHSRASVQTPAKKEELQVMGTGKNLTMLEEILMDNISQLKQDRGYLDQAKEINQHANSIIKIAKTKVDMVREIRKAREG